VKRNRKLKVISVFVGMLTISSLAEARMVILNGELLDAASLARLDQLHCEMIPDGSYWLRQRADGVYIWGYAALPAVAQGYLGESCSGASTHHALGNRKDPKTGLWKGTGGDSNCFYADGISFCP